LDSKIYNNIYLSKHSGIDNVLCWTKQKELLSKWSKFKQESFYGLKQGTFSVTDEEVPVFVLEKCENGLPITIERI
jgi:hypothetical protein